MRPVDPARNGVSLLSPDSLAITADESRFVRRDHQLVESEHRFGDPVSRPVLAQRVSAPDDQPGLLQDREGVGQRALLAANGVGATDSTAL